VGWEVSAVERAKELGTEHGTAAAEEWLRKYGPHSIGRIQASDFLNGRTKTPSDWPIPEVHKLDDWELGAVEWMEWATAYETAYGEAVLATVRAKCEEVTT
jgi:hypothetical protein